MEQRLSTVIAVPSFPSLIEEGNAGGGYDVRIDRPTAPLFLQFKIPRVITRRNKNSSEHAHLTPPHYRMYLHRRDLVHLDQHELLLDLCKKYSDVYYASPRFDTKSEIDSRHRLATIADATIFFRPTSIGTIADVDEHYVAYDAAGTVGYLCSEPKKIEVYESGFLTDLVDRLSSLPVNSQIYTEVIELCEGVARRLELNEIIAASIQGATAESNWALALRASYLVQVIFDCQLFVVSKTIDFDLTKF